MAREDATADIARELDLAKDPEPSLVRRHRVPATDEAGASNWQDVPEPFYLEVKIEAVSYTHLTLPTTPYV